MRKALPSEVAGSRERSDLDAPKRRLQRKGCACGKRMRRAGDAASLAGMGFREEMVCISYGARYYIDTSRCANQLIPTGTGLGGGKK